MAVAELTSVDGTISPTSEATVPVADDGLLRGDGVFEMARLYGGRPFALEEHLDRLGRSAATIELEMDRALLEREIEALLREFGGGDGALRIVLTRGGRRLVMTEELPAWPAAVSTATVTFAPSVILTGVKSISYAANMEASRIARRKGADEAILVRPDGVVLEAPTAALFWVGGDGALRTPSIETGILQSITRARIVEALDVAEDQFQVTDLQAASEACLASSTREVQPISAVDGRSLGDTPGPRTREAGSALAQAIERELS